MLLLGVFQLLSLSLIDWARQHGAHISDSIEIRSTAYGGRGLFAASRIPPNAELITLPGHLQLGVQQLAEGDDEKKEMQSLARALPWLDVLATGLTFLPCAIALCAEMRKGPDSIFEPYFRELPADYANAVAPWWNGDVSSVDGRDDELSGGLLGSWAPIMAAQVASRRRAMRTAHERLAPPSLSLHELCRASAVVCSRSIVRRRVRALTADETGRIGDFCSADGSRLLPVIDLVNHGGVSLSNVDVRHLGDKEGGKETLSTYDPYSTSLISKRQIAAGEEVLLDYGGGQRISNERLLLDYGFVLLEHASDTVLTLRLEDFLPALSTLDRAGMRDVSKEDVEGLQRLVSSILDYNSSSQGAPLLFGATGEPSLPTLVLALAFSCRGPDDVERLMTPVRAALDTLNAEGRAFEQLFMHLVESSTDAQTECALVALRTAASAALAQMPSIEEPPRAKTSGPTTAVGTSFDDVAREYCNTRRVMLQRVANYRGVGSTVVVDRKD